MYSHRELHLVLDASIIFLMHYQITSTVRAQSLVGKCITFMRIFAS